ncbi:hypothetical protein GOV14_01785 [Candidatus Pacearchaeota archaeon]|nr:hypothetical protein [Candidatus Pacearchaeota archaeon]
MKSKKDYDLAEYLRREFGGTSVSNERGDIFSPLWTFSVWGVHDKRQEDVNEQIQRFYGKSGFKLIDQEKGIFTDDKGHEVQLLKRTYDKFLGGIDFTAISTKDK